MQMNNAKPPSTRTAAIATYAVTLIACLAYLTYAYELWNANFMVPFIYGEDATLFLALTKGAIEHGWYLTNPSVGAPAGLEMHDFPMSDSLHYFAMKLIGTSLDSAPAAFNLYFLLTFPLTAMTTLFVLRRFQIPAPVAVVASLLFTFHPHHFFRNQGHLFLASYYLVPCVVMVALWLYLDRLRIFARDDSSDDASDLSQRRAHRIRWIGSVVICLLHASAGVYYAFFSCYMFLIAGCAAALQRKKLHPLYAALLLVVVTSGGVLANIGHHIAYNWEHGKNEEVAVRRPVDAEILGMKITELLLPIFGHRIERLAEVRQKYEQNLVAGGMAGMHETIGSGLGAAGAIGFLVLLAALLARGARPGEPNLLDGLSLFNVFAVLLSTVGGFGSLFAILVSPSIRAYNRFSIFLGFFALFALALLFRQLSERLVSSRSKILFAGLLAGLLGLGLFDQTPVDIELIHEYSQARFKNDADFVAQIEASLAPQSMVYQLPYMPFPEVVAPHRMRDYDPLRGYVHSKNLRWSYGMMKGRPAGNRQREMAARPIEEQLPMLAATGFGGIWIDRFGYGDHGAGIEQQIAAVLGVAPTASADGRFSFFNMTQYRDSYRSPSQQHRGAEPASQPRMAGKAVPAKSVARPIQ